MPGTGTYTSLAIAALFYALQIKSAHISSQAGVERRQVLPDPNALLPGWIDIGCFDNAPDELLLNGPNFTSPNMTPVACMNFCIPGGFGFAGVAVGNTCVCDFSMAVNRDSEAIEDRFCDMPCAGDRNLTCGGTPSEEIIQVFANNGSGPGVVHPTNKPFVSTWEYKGCYVEDGSSPQSRTLQNLMDLGSSLVTVEACTAACQTNNFPLAGLEEGNECWCGSFSQNRGAMDPFHPLPTNATCTAACAGNPTEICGAIASPFNQASFITIYQNTAAEIDLDVCFQTNIDLIFPFLSFPDQPPNQVQEVVLATDSTFPPNFFILSACTTIPCVDGGFGGTLTSGALTTAVEPFIVALDSFSVALSFPLVAGDSPTLMTSPTPPTPPGPVESGYCASPNPINPNGGPLFQPLALGVNGDASVWAVCTNISAGGRRDIVFKPIDNHPNYVKSDCEVAFIQLFSQ